MQIAHDPGQDLLDAASSRIVHTGGIYEERAWFEALKKAWWQIGHMAVDLGDAKLSPGLMAFGLLSLAWGHK